LIELLNEQKQVIIHRAVTKGLDSSARLKPSGVPWLGDIPEHWDVRRLKQISRILRGRFSHRPRNDAALYDGPYPFVQTGAVARADKFIKTYSQTLNERGRAVSKMFPSGTLVMTIAANIGDVAILSFDACFPDSVVGFVSGPSTNRDYLYLALRCMKAEFLREAPVNTQGNLNVERIGIMLVPQPPRLEQEKIAREIEDSTSLIDGPIDRARREIDLIREYQARLIADVATGQLDVREAARHLPAEAEESEAVPGGEAEEDAELSVEDADE
jgi:type I restriction enzyme S subunit